jgi:hypothetical protein
LGKVVKVKVTETHKWHISGHITDASPSIPHPVSDEQYFREREEKRKAEQAKLGKDDIS